MTHLLDKLHFETELLVECYPLPSRVIIVDKPPRNTTDPSRRDIGDYGSHLYTGDIEKHVSLPRYAHIDVKAVRQVVESFWSRRIRNICASRANAESRTSGGNDLSIASNITADVLDAIGRDIIEPYDGKGSHPGMAPIPRLDYQLHRFVAPILRYEESNKSWKLVEI